MELILKRGTEFTPIIFQASEIQRSKYCKLAGDEFHRISIKTIMNFPLSTDSTYIKRLVADRLKRRWLYFFPGGIMTEDIIVIAVYKNDNTQDQYIIAQTEFFQNHTTYLTKLKKYINDSGISSRTKLLLWNRGKIYSEFQELLNVEMKDYSTEVQKQLSSEFIIAQRSIQNIRKEDILPTPVVVNAEDLPI
jgi:hypothetical protein